MSWRTLMERPLGTGVGLAAGLVLALVGCLEVPPRAGDASSCTLGAEGCACTAGGGCDPGLTCLSQHCVNAGAGDVSADDVADVPEPAADAAETPDAAADVAGPPEVAADTVDAPDDDVDADEAPKAGADADEDVALKGAPAGTPCAAPEACESGHCVDGVCCDSLCDGVCERCDGTPKGTCAPVVGGPDPDTCAAAVGGACGAPKCVCDAGATCRPSPFAAMVTSSSNPATPGPGFTGVWTYAGELGVKGGNEACQAIGADHVCSYEEVVLAEAAGAFANLPDGTFWLHRKKAVTVAGTTYPPGPGGRCNDWTYPGTGTLAEGEYGSVSGGVVSYALDADTAYDGVSDIHYQGGLDCDEHRAIPCCWAWLPPG